MDLTLYKNSSMYYLTVRTDVNITRASASCAASNVGYQSEKESWFMSRSQDHLCGEQQPQQDMTYLS